MTFHVGQKVVCIRDDFKMFRAGGVPLSLPVKNSIYTVRWIGESVGFNEIKEDAIRLEELVNPVADYGHGAIAEGCFAAKCFRPIVERKTDISIFKKMLTDIPETVE